MGRLLALLTGGGAWLYGLAAVSTVIAGLALWGLAERATALKVELVAEHAVAVQAQAEAEGLQAEIRRLALAESARSEVLARTQTQLNKLREAVRNAPDTHSCSASPAVRALRDRLRAPNPG